VATVADERMARLTVVFQYQIQGRSFGPFQMSRDGSQFYGTLDPDFSTQSSISVPIQVTAYDDRQQSARRETKIALSGQCPVG
jgi:hypothetical protein